MSQRTPFTQRVITALIFGFILLVPIFIGSISGLIVLGILCGLTVIEYLSLQRVKTPAFYLIVLFAVFMYISLCGLILTQGIVDAVRYAALLCVLFDLLLIYRLYKARNPFNFHIQLLPSVLYVAIPIALLYGLASFDGQYRPRMVVAILCLIWINDVMAYLVGRRFGKTPFAPLVSPKKTWEGSIAGYVATVVLGVLIHFILDHLAMWEWMVIGFIVGTIGSIGDLVESLFKRKLGIKDSGTFLPGHGGLLDRLDSLLFAVPFVVLFLFIADYI